MKDQKKLSSLSWALPFLDRMVHQVYVVYSCSNWSSASLFLFSQVKENRFASLLSLLSLEVCVCLQGKVHGQPFILPLCRAAKYWVAGLGYRLLKWCCGMLLPQNCGKTISSLLTACSSSSGRVNFQVLIRGVLNMASASRVCYWNLHFSGCPFLFLYITWR